MKLRVVIFLLAAGISGCVPLNKMGEWMFAASPFCPTEKIRFTQADGCLNDGSFEFCIANDANLLIGLYQRIPNMACIPSGGRARCDIQTQMLCLVSTEGLCRPDQPYALTDEGWQLACSIAARPYIETIVATWYE